MRPVGKFKTNSSKSSKLIIGLHVSTEKNEKKATNEFNKYFFMGSAQYAHSTRSSAYNSISDCIQTNNF